MTVDEMSNFLEIRSKKDGFTLVEVLVSLGLISLLFTIVISIINQLRPIKKIQDIIDAKIEAETLAEYLGKNINQALFLPLSQKNPQQRMMLIGSEQSINFVSIIRTGAYSYGLRDVTIYFKMSEDGKGKLIQSSIVRRRNYTPKSEYIELAEITGLKFQYRKKINPIAFTWSNEWDTIGNLPQWVRFEITLKRKNQTVTVHRVTKLKSSKGLPSVFDLTPQ